MRAGLFVLLATRGGAGVLQAFTLVLLARSVSVPDFGAIGAGQGIFLALFAIADVGVSGFLLRARSQGESEDVNRALTLNALTSLVAIGLVLTGVIIVTHRTTSDLSLSLCILAVAFGLEKSIDSLLSVPLADRNSRVAGVSILMRRFLGLVGAVSLVSIGTPALTAYSIAYLIGCLVAQFHVVHYVRRNTHYRRGSVVDAMRLLSRTWPFMLYFVAGQVRALDVSIVALAAGQTVAGVYNAALRVTSPLQQIPTAVSQLVIPAASQGGRNYIGKALRRFDFVGLALAVSALPLALYGELLLRSLLGQQYNNTGTALFWSVEAMIFISLAGPLSALLQVQNRERTAATIAVSFTTLALSVVGIVAWQSGAQTALLGLALVAVLRCAALRIVLRWI